MDLFLYLYKIGIQNSVIHYNIKKYRTIIDFTILFHIVEKMGKILFHVKHSIHVYQIFYYI